MKLLTLSNLGAREVRPKVLDFGVILPGVTAQFAVKVRIIHSADQFIQSIQPIDVSLSKDAAGLNGYDSWSGSVDLARTVDSQPGSHWGQEGQYVYRLCITRPDGVVVDNVSDPYSREAGVGRLSAITVGYQDYVWSAAEANWKTPDVRDLILYEMMLSEFDFDIDGAIDRLDYLKDLGINCIEVMPITSCENTIDWGYDPIGYFSVSERFGQRKDFQRFVDAAHQRGIAVVLDAVFGQTDASFAYVGPYGQLGIPSPYSSGQGQFGQAIDISQPLAQDFIYTVSMFWLDKFHVDGLRFDAAQEYRDGPTGQGYDNLVYLLYTNVKANATAASPGHWGKFMAPNGSICLLQIAEYLDGDGRSSPDILETSYSNSVWQDRTLWAARQTATDTPGAIDSLGNALGAAGFPTVVTLNSDTIVRSPLQYLENHDHERLICSFGVPPADDVLLEEGDRSKWYKLQPYLIGLLTAKGTPFLWQGEEFCENYFVPNTGYGRVQLLRPTRWEYFYDGFGKPLVNLVRQLTRIRQAREQFRRGDHYFESNPALYEDNGLLLFARWTPSAYSLVALNFTDADVSTSFWFPIAGSYVEELQGGRLDGVVTTAATPFTVPGNYGCIWTAGGQ
jgi:1,4-alpha-glucan branching enzyme